LFVAGPETGVRVSRDGGRTWADAGLADAVVNGLAIAPNAGGACLVFAATDAGIFRSPDRGTTWEAPVPGGESPAALIAVGTAGDGGSVPVFAATGDGRLIV